MLMEWEWVEVEAGPCAEPFPHRLASFPLGDLVPNVFCLPIGASQSILHGAWKKLRGHRERTPSLRCSWTPQNCVVPSSWVCPKSAAFCCLTGCSYQESLLWKTDLSLCSSSLIPKPLKSTVFLKSISTDFHGLEIRFHCLFNSESQQFLTTSFWIFFPQCGIKRCYLT